jgi:hypothetical protein
MFTPILDGVLVAMALLVDAAIVISLRVILAPPVVGSRLVVVRGEPGTGTSRAAWEAVAGALAGWPLEFPRIAAVLDMASCIKRHAVASAWLSGGETLPLAGVWPAAGRPSRGGTGSAPGPVAACCGDVIRRRTDA